MLIRIFIRSNIISGAIFKILFRSFYAEILALQGFPAGLRDSYFIRDKSGYPEIQDNQTFSIAGSRKGFGDPRGTLFFELARLAEARKPSYLLFENVPGLLSHDGGRTFATILNTLDRLGYGVEWQSFANSPSPRADQLRAKGERPSVRMELSDITAYLRRKVEPPKDRMPKMPVKIKRKEKTL